MQESITFVGMDAHKKNIQVAMLTPDMGVTEWTVHNEPAAVRRMVKKIQREAKGEVMSCYEAGPCGYELQRRIRAQGMECIVIAPPHSGDADGCLCRPGAIPGTSCMASMLPGYRYRHSADHRCRIARLQPVQLTPPAHGLPGTGTQ